MSGNYANNPEQPALKLAHLSLENAAKILSAAMERIVPEIVGTIRAGHHSDSAGRRYAAAKKRMTLRTWDMAKPQVVSPKDYGSRAQLPIRVRLGRLRTVCIDQMPGLPNRRSEMLHRKDISPAVPLQARTSCRGC